MLTLPDFLEDELSIVIKPEQELSDIEADITALPPEVEEQVVVKDLLYCLIGATGSYIKPNQSGHYQVTSRMHGSNLSFVDQVLPVCDDYSMIRIYSEGHFAFQHGRIIHAFCAAVRTVTSEYIQMVAKMESYRRLTLALIVSNLQGPTQSLRIRALLIAELGDKRGCQALAVVHGYLSGFKGSQQIRKLLQYIFQSSAAPLLTFVEKWIYEGLIDDPFDEFFIKINETISPEVLGPEYEGQFWNRRFELVHDRLLHGSFLSKSAVEKIMFAGKAIAVLTICGLKMPKVAKLTLQALQRETVLDSARLNASLRLVTALRERYELLRIINIFHAVYLGGRGDWIYRFLKQGKSIMKQQRENIHLPALDTAVALSLPPNSGGIFSAVLKEDQLIDEVKRIHSVSVMDPTGKRQRPSPFTSTWDHFDLNARIEWPLSLVFTETVQRKYQLLFRTIIAWRRLEGKLGHCLKHGTGIRQFERMRYAMQLFVTGYLNFTSTVIIRGMWNGMMESLQKTVDIEELFQVHEDALDSAMKGFFLTDAKSFDLLNSIALACTQFTIELKKWKKTVNHKGITPELKIRHGKPMKTFYEVFEKKVQQLIQNLIALSNRETNQMYSSFLKWININDAYVLYVEPRLKP
jgi:gamma-tubulin complex component 2